MPHRLPAKLVFIQKYSELGSRETARAGSGRSERRAYADTRGQSMGVMRVGQGARFNRIIGTLVRLV